MRRPRQSPSADVDLHVRTTLGNVDRLPRSLEIDGVFYPPCAYLVADDIVPATGAWASRHDATKTLSVAGAGADPTYGNATAIENSAVKYEGAKYHTASDTTWGQIADNDGAIECLFNVVDSALLCTRASGSTAGFSIQIGSSAVSFLIGDGTDYVNTTASATITQLSIVHWMAFIDKSDKAYHYVNGIYHSVSAATTAVGNSTGGALAVGSLSGGVTIGNHAVELCAIWDLPTNPFPGVLKNRTYFDRIAAERFAIVSGTADRNQGRNTFTRATPAYLDKFVSSTERQLFQVSSHWPRVCERKDTNGTLVRAYLPEPQAINKCLYSGAMMSWTGQVNLTAVAIATAPDGASVASGVVANATDALHGFTQDITLAASMHCFSVWAKKENKSWAYLASSTANVTCFFNVDAPAVGTAGAGVTTAGIEPHPYLTGWYRCWVIFTGSTDAKTFGLYAANADGDADFASASPWPTAVHFWGAQVEAVTEHFPSSYIPTVAAASTRNKDELSTNVRLPIVGNISDLPMVLEIDLGGEVSSHDPCAYLVADDIQADGTWASRHATYGTNSLTDGNMEAADTSYWTAGASATLSKETGTPHGGTNCMRCARNSSNNPHFLRTGSTVVGKTYRLQGYARSDGSCAPRIYDSGAVLLFTGTTSTSWQAFDITYVAAGSAPYFYAFTSTGTQYTEWDDISLQCEAKLAFAGAGTNPTRQWDAVSRANKSVKYWASNYHIAADTTWGRTTSGDSAIEAIWTCGPSVSRMIASTYNGTAPAEGFYLYFNAATPVLGFLYNGTSYVVTGTTSTAVGSCLHVMVCIDVSDKAYMFVNGVYAGASASLAGATINQTSEKLAIGAHPAGSNNSDSEIALISLWDLPANPWPGAATNQAVMGAIAAARCKQLFQYQQFHCQADILYPNTDAKEYHIAFSSETNGTSGSYYYMGSHTNDNPLIYATLPSDGSGAGTVGEVIGTGDINDGVKHRLETRMRTNRLELRVDGATNGTIDTACLVPMPLSRFKLGTFVGSFHACGLVGNLKLSRSDK